MTKQEKLTFDEYGTAYPCCGNCTYIREAGFKLMCAKHLQYRDYSSVKCLDYDHKQFIDKLKILD